MSYSSRVYRQRNAHQHESENERSPFFSRTGKRTKSPKNGSAFFQAKLSIGQPNDSYEQEADAVANAVVNHRGKAPAVQQKKISSIQRLATSMEDEKLATNDERMLKDKEIQEKPEIQTMCSDCEKDKDEKKGAVQTKAEGGSTASPQVSSAIKGTAGKGNSLSKKTLSEMNASFGVDFSNVNVHTGREAAQMNKELRAQAFTHGRDIYFNHGKYDPESSEGKQLLAHELTHVVQQGYAAEKDETIQLQDEEQQQEKEEQTGSLLDDLEIPLLGNDLPGLLGGDIIPGEPLLTNWTTDFLGITLQSRNALCAGSATPKSTVLMSQCNASSFCSNDFNFRLFFHFDADIIKRPQPFSDADLAIDLDFVPDGQRSPTFSKHASGKGVYDGPGAPLKTPFGNSFLFTTNTDGNFIVFARMTDPASGKTITYNDTIRCTIIPCL